MPSVNSLRNLLLAVLLIGFNCANSKHIPSRSERRLLSSDEALTWRSGTLIIRTLSYAGGDDAEAYLLRTQNKGRLIELDIDEGLVENASPGQEVTVHGSFINDDKMHVVEIFPTELRSTSSSFMADNSPPPSYGGDSSHSHRRRAAEQTGNQVEAEVDDYTAYDENGNPIVPEPRVAVSYLPSYLKGIMPWTQIRTVKEMPTLVMIVSICGAQPVASVKDVERMMFKGHGSFARNLEGYLSECSGGQAYLNSSNSLVVGNISIPCSYESDDYSFSSESCSFNDNDGWHIYAQQYVTNVLGIGITRYRHRVLLMPALFTTLAGCMWLGQGTLGPDRIDRATGAFLSSKVWLTGEYWNIPLALFHELGHTNYLHHSVQNGCQYCDMTCAMGACCDLRCFNPPHNWQLGWSSPIMTLNTVTFTPGTWVTLELPAQHTSTTNMILIQPNWNQMYNFTRAYMWFIGYRVESGQYDAAIPDEYTYQTNLYLWTGGYQALPVMTNFVGSIYDNQEMRNMTDMFVIRQLSSSYHGAVVSLCRITQISERDCGDGLDNDCDGYIDGLDTDCGGAAYAGTNFSDDENGNHPPRPPAPSAPPSPSLPPPPLLSPSPSSPPPPRPSPPSPSPPSPPKPSPAAKPPPPSTVSNAASTPPPKKSPPKKSPPPVAKKPSPKAPSPPLPTSPRPPQKRRPLPSPPPKRSPPIKQGRLSKLEDSVADSDDVWMEEAEVIPSILDGTDHSELIASISAESSAEALQRLKEEQKKTYGSRRPLVKWWLQESAEEEEARKNKGWEL